MLKLLRNEALATARCALYRLEHQPIARQSGTDVQQATLIVHGLMGRAQMFYPMADYLGQKGLSRIAYVEYPSKTSTIDDIIYRIQTTMRMHNASHWNIVAHSLGAVAVRAALKKDQLDVKIRRFIALGAPFNGTKWYPLAPPLLREAFDPKGDWCKQLNTLPEPDSLRIVRARHDQNVRPSRNASLQSVPETVLSHVGHNGLINHPDVFKAVWSFLM